MSKINHSRPSLRLADNIRRELNKRALSRTEKKTHSAVNKPKRQTFWDKMLAIGLSEEEENLLLRLFESASDLMDNTVGKLELVLAKNKAKRMKILEAEGDEIYENMLSTARALITLDIKAKLSGRQKGLGEWLNLLKPKLKRDGAEDVWDLINNDVLKTATEQVEAVLNAHIGKL